MSTYENDYTFIIANQSEPSLDQVVSILKRTGAQMHLNYLLVGPENVTRFYAEFALEANIRFINNIPVCRQKNQLL